MGQPCRVNHGNFDAKSESKPGEVKHLSTRRKREQSFIPQVAASEKGPVSTRREPRRESPNLFRYALAYRKRGCKKVSFRSGSNVPEGAEKSC